MGKNNINKSHGGRRKPSKHTKARMAASASTSNISTRSTRSSVQSSGTTRAVSGTSVTLGARVVSKKKAKKLERDAENKRKRKLAEALERSEDLEMTGTGKMEETNKPKIATGGRKLAAKKAEAANDMEVDAE